MKRTVYNKQYKVTVSKLALCKESAVAAVAKELGLSNSTLHRWVNEYKEYGENAFSGRGNTFSNYDFEVKKLQKANEELKKLQAFLKQNNESTLGIR